jgi:hypothetical protein
MSLVYALLLAVVGVIVVAEAVAVVLRLSAPPPWRRTPAAMRPALVPVETEERRRQSLAYVGRDRRAAVAARQAGNRRQA